ncbi:hypothetical protein [Rugosimonospora acidiphila]|uniref:hypothetical protein n=1 Tax=Rugosimonospora acidiphila TaxID=556531 RepID=UPI0031EF6160
MDGLFDVELVPGPDGDLRGPRSGTPMDAHGLAELVQRTGGAGDDVRIVMAGAGRHAAVFAELAGLLGRDVLITPAGGETRWPSGRADAAPSLDAATPVDAATACPADWRVVQPPAMATDLPGWYDTSDGVVRERTGTVTLPLPGGLMLATRADFVARRAAAATLLPGHAELTTIGAAVRAGGFVVGDYAGGHEVADGRRLAASLAELPLYGTEVRMWIAWPADRDEQERLDRNLRNFAETTGAIVWAPAPEATTEVLDGCRDLSVSARDGRPATWRVYSPTLAGIPRFESDADGRLSPAGELLTRSTDGVPLISVPPDRWRAARHWYAEVAPRGGLFAVDLTVLPDGRWAVQHAGSGPHVLGPREFQRVLRSTGWRGEDLMLLASYPAGAGQGLRRHGRWLADDLGAGIWVLPAETDIAVRNGIPRALDRQGRPVAWERLADGDSAHWRSADGILLPADVRPDGSRSTEGQGPVRRTSEVVPDPAPAATGRDGSECDPDAAPNDPLTGEKPPVERALAGGPVPSRNPFPMPPTGSTPRLHSARSRLKHGIYWLADRPRVNADPIDLYVICGATPDQVAEDGLPTPHLFAVGLLRPPAPDSLRPGENLVRVRVGEAGAVDLSSIDVHVPPTLQLLLSGWGESYLLPGGLLERTRLLAGYLTDPAGGYRPGPEFGGEQPLRLRCRGARHGIDGLPADVPRWPRAADTTAYALLPGSRVAAAGGALAMLSGKPRPKAGHRLLQLRVPRRRAIDVRAVTAQLAELSSVLSCAGALNGEKIELILPARDYDTVTVLQVLAPGRLSWRSVPGSGGVPLTDFLASDGGTAAGASAAR